MVTSSLHVPFTIEVLVSNVPQPEMVTVTAEIHIVTQDAVEVVGRADGLTVSGSAPVDRLV